MNLKVSFNCQWLVQHLVNSKEKLLSDCSNEFIERGWMDRNCITMMLFITFNHETALSEEAQGVSSWSKCQFLVAAAWAALEEQFQSGQDETQADRGSLVVAHHHFPAIHSESLAVCVHFRQSEPFCYHCTTRIMMPRKHFRCYRVTCQGASCMWKFSLPSTVCWSEGSHTVCLKLHIKTLKLLFQHYFRHAS